MNKQNLKPYSRRLKVRDDAWMGQVVEGAKFVCDGHTIIPLRCVVSKERAQGLMTKARERNEGPATLASAEKVWEEIIANANIDCELSGFLDWPESHKLGYFKNRVGVIGSVRVDVDKLRLIDELTKFDSIRKSKNIRKAVVFLRDGEEVAALMPLDPNPLSAMKRGAA